MADTKLFTLEGKGLKLDTAADVEVHIADLRANDVEEVRLLGNTLGVEACKALGEVLATKKNLRVANFADIFTGRLISEIPDALRALCDALTDHTSLVELNLSDNAFGGRSAEPMVNFLKNNHSFSVLKLNNNGLGPHAGILIADSLSELHAKKEAARKEGQEVPDLETVICGRNRLENGSMTAWAKTYKLHNKIKQIKMVQNGIRQEGIAHLLSEGLNHATELRVLDLQDNTFTILAARALSKVTPGWTELRELGVGDSLLSAKGGKLLAKALANGKNTKLEILRLQYNDITAPGVKALAEAAKSSLPALKRVELNGNKFSEDDESVTQIQELLDERKEKLGGDVVNEDEWGVDDLSDLEDEDSDDEKEEDSDDDEDDKVDVEERAEKL
ncbi:hypothetical protein Golomagni_06438, partial [Golovinomyces magnicellulatus]